MGEVGSKVDLVPFGYEWAILESKQSCAVKTQEYLENDDVHLVGVRGGCVGGDFVAVVYEGDD